MGLSVFRKKKDLFITPHPTSSISTTSLATDSAIVTLPQSTQQTSQQTRQYLAQTTTQHSERPRRFLHCIPFHLNRRKKLNRLDTNSTTATATATHTNLHPKQKQLQKQKKQRRLLKRHHQQNILKPNPPQSNQHYPPNPMSVNHHLFEKKLGRRKRPPGSIEQKHLNSEHDHVVQSPISSSSLASPTSIPIEMNPTLSLQSLHSLDTKKSTPKATCRSTLYRSDTQKVTNRTNEHDHPTSTHSSHCTLEEYTLPQSITFLSLVLPCDINLDSGYLPLSPSPSNHLNRNPSSQQRRKEERHLHLNSHSNTTTTATPSLVSVSDATSTTDMMSITSGQTTLAKDRVQETIACSLEVEQYLTSLQNKHSYTHHYHQHQHQHHHPYQETTTPCEDEYDPYDDTHHTPLSPLSAPIQPLYQSKPINVDFVLESNEAEITSFANSYIQTKQYTEAIDIYLSILDHYQKTHGPHYPFVMATLHNLGVVHVWNGKYNKALPYCREVLKRRRMCLGEEHLDVAVSLCELGIIYYAREDFNRGLEVLRQALQISCLNCKDKSHGDLNGKVEDGKDRKDGSSGTCRTNPEYKVASILNNIGCLHFSMGKLIASIATFEESLDIQRNMMGSISSEDAPCILLNMSITLCNAGIVSAKHNRIEVASSLVEEGLMVQQSVLPDNHRFVKTTSLTLSRLLHKDKDFNSPHYDELQTLEISLPRQLSNTMNQLKIKDALSQCTDMLPLGSVESGGWNSQQRVSYSMQLKFLAQALVTEGNSKRHCSWVDVGDGKWKGRGKGKGEAGFSEDSCDLYQVCQQASQLIQKKDINKATSLLFEIRRSRTNKCGDVDVIVASTHHIVGLIYLHTKNYQSARVEFQEASKIRSRQLDPDHLDVLASQTKLAITLMALQDFDKAISIFQTLLTHLRRRFGYSHYRAAIILNNIGICHCEFGGLLAALKSFEEAVEILQEAMNNALKEEEGGDVDGDDKRGKCFDLKILYGRSLQNLGFIRFKRKEYAEAVVALEKCLKINRDAFGSDHKLVKATIESLAFIMATANCLDNKDKLDHMKAMYIEMLGLDGTQ